MKPLACVLMLVVVFLLTSCTEVSSPEPLPPVGFAVTGDSQVRFPSIPLVTSLAIRLVDEHGESSQTGDIPVTWTVVEGGGTLGRAADTTAGTGMARTSWTLGPNEGVQRVRVEVGSFEPYLFTAEALRPGPIAFVSNRRTGDEGDGFRVMAGDVFVMEEVGGGAPQQRLFLVHLGVERELVRSLCGD